MANRSPLSPKIGSRPLDDFEKKHLSFERQLFTCSSSIIASFAAGMLILREDKMYSHYEEDLRAVTIKFVPIMGDMGGIFGSAIVLCVVGRKYSLIIMHIVFMVSVIIFLAEISPSYDFLGNVILHAGIRYQAVATGVYIAEVTDPRMRVFFMSLPFLAYRLGYVVHHSLFTGTRILVLAALVLLIVSTILSFHVYETPYWLALTGYRDDAEDTFDWLRADTAHIPESIIEFDKAEIEANQKQNYLVPNVSPRKFFVPLTIIIFMYLAHSQICYLVKEAMADLMANPQFETEAKIASTSSHATICNILVHVGPIIGGLMFAGLSFVAGRRLLFFLCIALSLLFFPTLLLAADDINVPLYMSVLCYLFNNMGANQITHILPCEIFPAIMRDIGTATCELMDVILIATETVRIYGGPTTWYYRTINNVRWALIPLGIVGSLFYLPETKNMTLTEAEVIGGDLKVVFLSGRIVIGTEETA